MKRGLFSYYTLPILISVSMHAALLALLYLGWESAGSEKRETPRYIEAKIVQLEASTPEEVAAPEPEPQVIDVAAQREEAERQRREEEARRQAEQRRAQAEQERREQERREEEQREQERQEQERREQEAAERRKMQEALAEELEAERSQLQARKNAEIAQSYTALIADKVEGNWSRPPSARNGMEAELAIQLVPTGRVVGVEIIESSGDPAFDRSAERAVQKAEEFPELRDMPSAVFEQEFRQFILKFSPRDLRQ